MIPIRRSAKTVAVAALVCAGAAHADLAYVPSTDCDATSPSTAHIVRVVDLDSGDIVRDVPMNASTGAVMIDPVDHRVMAISSETNTTGPALNEVSIVDPRTLDATRRISYPYVGYRGATLFPVTGYRAPGAAEFIAGFSASTSAYARVDLSGASSLGTLPNSLIYVYRTGGDAHFATIGAGTDLVDAASMTVRLHLPQQVHGLYVDGDRFYASDTQNVLRAFDIGSGAELWQASLPGQGTRAVMDEQTGRLVVAYGDGAALVDLASHTVEPIADAGTAAGFGLDIVGRSAVMLTAASYGCPAAGTALKFIDLDPPHATRTMPLGAIVPEQHASNLDRFVGPDLRAPAGSVPTAIDAVPAGSFAWYALTLGLLLAGVIARRRRA